MRKNKVYQDGTIEDINDEYFNFNRDGVDFLVNRDKFIYHSSIGVQMSCRTEPRKDSANSYWVAYKRVNGVLNKRYLGTPAQMSIESLERTCTEICKSESKKSEQSNDTRHYPELTAKLDQLINYIEKQKKYLEGVPPTSKTGQKRGDTPRYKHSLQLIDEIAEIISN